MATGDNKLFSQIKDYISHNIYTLMNSLIFGGATELNNQERDQAVKVGGLTGIFGQKDERVVQIILNEMEKKKPGSKQVMADFLGWLFPKSEDHFSNWFISYKMDQFTTFVAKMGSTSGQKTGEIKTVETNGTSTTTTTTDIRSEGVNNGLALFWGLFDIIESESIQEKGFEKCRKYMESVRIPCIKEGWLDKTNTLVLTEKLRAEFPEMISEAKKSSEKFAAYLEEKLKKREEKIAEKHNWWRRFCKKFL